jgi:hypothetical protein
MVHPVSSAMSALGSILAHLGLAWLVVGASQGGRQIPTDEREARVFFLLPPDRVDVRPHQTEVFQWGKVGGDLLDGRHLAAADEGWSLRPRTYGARPAGDRSGARAQVPFGPPATLRPDSVFSVLEVDEMVERHPGSAAPAYPPDLLAIGVEGLVQASYVVDTTGGVDTMTIQVLHSDDPRFTESVRTALGLMRFRAATRGGKAVRQLVEQKFRFRIAPPAPAAPAPS